VTPVIGEITTRPLELSSLQLNEQEVTEAFAIPIDQLIAPAACRYTQFRNGFTLPVYNVSPHRIWGLTAVITFQFLRVFLAKHSYKHTLRFQPPISHS
jgi:nudix motif 8